MRKKRPYKRKKLNFKIKREMQIRILLRLGAILLLSLLICGAIYYVFSNEQISRSYRQFHVQADNFLDLLLPVIIASLCLGFIIGATVSLFFPKRIAGPLFRIERELRAVTSGDLSLHIKLRKGDELSSLADHINEMAAGLGKRISELKKLSDEAQSILLSRTDPEEGMIELGRIHDSLSRGINSFRLSGEG